MEFRTPVRVNSDPFLAGDRAAIAATLPVSLQPLADEIVYSRRILDWPDDFDDEGSPGYDAAVWLRAVEFVVANALALWQDRQVIVPAPSIDPGPYGSIDLHWLPPGRELLLNIPIAPDAPARFYGDDGAFGHVVKGSLDPSDDNTWLMLWLTST